MKKVEDAYIEDEAIFKSREARTAKVMTRITEAKIVDELMYRSYRAQRLLYDLTAERCAKFYDDATLFEIRLQEELNPKARENEINKGRMYRGKSDLNNQPLN